jgi:uncharacterized protein
MLRFVVATFTILATAGSCGTEIESMGGAKSFSQSGGKEEVPSTERCIARGLTAPNPATANQAYCPTDPIFGGLQLRRAAIRFPDAPGHPIVDAELATTPKERQRGLMYRKSMLPDSGMLFVFKGEPRIHSFWMRNTCLSLDMIFATQDGFIAGIIENVPILNDKSQSIKCSVNYILEVNGGWARRNGVFAGQRIVLPD